jgi:D-beta-D-heptose 7-phosphate kinase / D-beta-D-heptose 1-phosphate adenosyltransferase
VNATHPNSAHRLTITVVGDTLLDVDVSGSAARLSPDAPVPVVEARSITRRAGGAGLVATMLARDGHRVRLVTALSDDANAGQLRHDLHGIQVIAGPSGAPTPVKTRVRAGTHPVVRIDEGCATPPVPEATAAMLDAVAGADAIVVADYGRRLTENPQMRAALQRRGTRVPLVWDPHAHGAPPVRSAAAVTPNLAEATAVAGIEGTDVTAAAESAAILQAKWGCAAVVVTLGVNGALLHHPERATSTVRGHAGYRPAPLVIPATAVADIDPCGAGDRLSATVAVELLRGATIDDAVAAGVREAGAFLAAGGVSGLHGPDRGASADAHPLGGATAALRLARETRLRGGTVVATGGCFDLMHAGHARTLAAARKLGDCLIVCLNSDASVRRLKGPDRPLVSQDDRVDLLMALECVDAVLVFDEDTPESVLRRLQPDVWVKGGDYTPEELPEAKALEAWGGRTVTVPYYPGRSSSGLASALSRVG